jgi:type VI secretion system secreted protein Hcp
MAIYMKYTNPSITGGVSTKGYAGQVDILSFSEGVSRDVKAATGKGGNREAGTPYVSEIQLSKELDESSGDLLKEAYGGQGKATVTLTFIRTDTAGGTPYLVYTLSNVMLSSYQISGTGSDRPMESFALNFTKIETKFTPQKDDGTAGTPAVVTYDLTQQTST